MSFFLYIAFAGAISCLVLGTYVISQDHKNAQRRIFFLICVSLSLLNFVSIPAYSANTKQRLFLWTEMASCCVNLFYALNLHFYINLLKKKLSLWKIPVLYIPAAVIIVVYAIDPLLMLDYKLYGGEWKLVPNYESHWFYISAGYCIVYALLSIVTIFAYGKMAVSNKEKLQAKLIIANLALSTTAGILGLWVIPYFNYTIPNIGPTYHLLYVLGLYYSVFYLKFLDFKPSIIADEIISNISDMVLLLGPDLKVILANNIFLETLSLDSAAVTGKQYQELIHEKESIVVEAGSMKTGKTDHIKGNKRSDLIMTDTYFSKVTDRFSDIIGFLVISRINKGRRQFQIAYNITDRELEIVDRTLAGLSSREIGKELGISDRTVQSHQEHVYQKLGATGKVELVRIAHEFNLNARQ